MRIVFFFLFDVVVNSVFFTVVLCCAYIYIPFEFKNTKRAALFLSALLVVVSAVLLYKTQIPSFLKTFFEDESSFYKENYIDPKNIDFVFPAQKRNLLVIFVESLETGFLDLKHRGAFNEDLLPEVRELCKNNINISNSNDIGGAYQLSGTGWTMAGIVAAYTGIHTVSMMNHTNGKYIDDVLPGAVALGDICSGAGYKNYFLCGSDGKFSWREQYFKTHGGTTVYDYYYFLDNGSIPQGYHVFWGFEDRKLYGLAKEKLLEINAAHEPFFFTMITTGTHAPDGYLDDVAANTYDTKFKNVLRDASIQLNDFILWTQKQDWYQNTTIVVLGDHLFINSSVFPKNLDVQQRYPINIFINSNLSDEHIKNRRISQFDIFPLLLDSIGVDYKTKGLGLGRRVDRGEETLLETFGIDDFNKSLKGKSAFYTSLFKPQK